MNVLQFPAANSFKHKEPVNDFSASIRRQMESAPLHRTLITAYVAALEECMTFEAMDRATAINDFGMQSHDPAAIRKCIEQLNAMINIVPAIRTERRVQYA